MIVIMAVLMRPTALWRRVNETSPPRYDRGTINLISGLRVEALCVYFCLEEVGAGKLTMVGRLHGLTRVGRQFAAVVLTFALLLQGVALAVATGSLATNAATDAGWAAFELCQHKGSADDNSFAPGGAPESSDTHCIFCLAGVSYALETPLPSVAFHIIAITIAPWIFTVWLLPALTVDASARPRGPPSSA